MRSVAFYLPQFHPIPENDRWWGEGFTEWTNVRQGRARFDGHEQPHVAGELGYYDLRDPETRAAQAELARSHSIDAFCYFHYWMHGIRLLERPFTEVLASGEPDVPFCLCWANHDWVRNWDAATGELLMPQRYSADDDRAHARWLTRAFGDHRYLRADGKPLFLVYWVSHLPDARRFSDIVREEAARAGVGELALWSVESAGDSRAPTDPRPLGFDGSVEFQPDWPNLRSRLPGYGRLSAYDYRDVVRRMLAKPTVEWRRAPGVMPRWDNTPRRPDDGTVLIGSTPALYREWVTAAAANASRMNPDDPMLFVTSWNEWAEGSHLEPCERHGRAYLEAHRDGIAAAKGVAAEAPPVAVRHRLREHPVVRSALRTKLARPLRRMWRRHVERGDRLG